MDDPVNIALIMKSALAGLLIVGGIIALFIGRGLYLRGIGLLADDTHIEVRNIKASLKTVGSVVMVTSVAWGGLGYLTSPSFSRGEQGTQVTSLEIPELTVKAYPFVVAGLAPSTGSFTDGETLVKFFTKAFKDAQQSTTPVTVNDAKAELEASRTSAFRTGAHRFVVVGFVKAGNKDVALAYVPKWKEGKLLFVPDQIGVLEEPEDPIIRKRERQQ